MTELFLSEKLINNGKGGKVGAGSKSQNKVDKNGPDQVWENDLFGQGNDLLQEIENERIHRAGVIKDRIQERASGAF
jgi:hypothetical protein